MTEQTQPTDAEIETLGHRMCWRYKHDTGVNHISTFTFNAQTLHDFARAVLAKWGTHAGAGEVVAWLVPHLRTFKGATKVHFTRAPGCTMTDAELMDDLEGRVMWLPSTFSDSPGVTDKFGVHHKPKPLFTTPQPTQAQAGAVPAEFLRSVIALCTQRGYSPENIEAWSKDDKWVADLWRQAEQMLNIKGADHA